MRLVIALLLLIAHATIAHGSEWFTFSSNDTKTKTLRVGDSIPYSTVIRLDVPPEAECHYVHVVASAHGNPQQKTQKELAWSTGVRLYDGTEQVKTISRPRGQDLYKSQKAWDMHSAWFVMPRGLEVPLIKYEMRALNKKSGGKLKLSWAKVRATVGAPVEGCGEDAEA